MTDDQGNNDGNTEGRLEDKGLTLEGNYPLLISTRQALPETAELLAINESNESLLRASLILNEAPDLDDHDPVSIELRRQDIKINFLLDMVSELLSQHNIVPPPQSIKLTATSLQCRVDTGVRSGDTLEIDVYLNPATPRALRLFGMAESAGQDGVITITLQGTSRAVQDQLEKIIFRQHRRMVALSRQGGG